LEFQACKTKSEEWKTKLQDLEARKRQRAEHTSEPLETYSDLQGRQICQKLHATLPLELRNEVYGYLIPKVVRKGLDVVHYSTNLQRLSILPERRQFRPSYIGRDIYRELVDYFYRTTRFYFGPQCMGQGEIRDHQVMIRWLHQADREGIIPAHHVNKIELHCTHQELDDELDPFSGKLAASIGRLVDCRNKISFHT
jgi:hypothetical protein